MNKGVKLKERRKNLRMTLKEVANAVGVAEATVQRWESGNIENIRADKLTKLSMVLQLPIEELTSWFDKQAEWTMYDSKIDTEKLSVEATMWEFIDKQYGKATTEIIHDLLELKPKDQEKIGKLLEGYSKLDGEDRIILFGRICQILEDMLSAEKYTCQKESSNGTAM